LAASLSIGAIIGGASEEEADKLYECGKNLGIAFQLQDDILDTFGDPEVFGKKLGGDIACNKKTYLLLKTMELADNDQRREIDEWLKSGEEKADEKIQAIIGLYNQVGVRQNCETQIFPAFIQFVSLFF